MTNLVNIEAKDLPKCGVCKGREVVTGYKEKKGKKIKLSFYCHGEEDVFEIKEGDKLPDVAFAPKKVGKPKGKAQTVDDNLDGIDEQGKTEE